MTTVAAVSSSRLSAPAISLWTPPHRRWLAALQRLTDPLHDALSRAARRRALVEAAATERVLRATLDARTLRDIGLGDWGGRSDEPGAAWASADPYRF